MTRKQNAFTLVEILIVVIILGILAAIVIPQFTSASEEAAQKSTMTDLQALRTQVQLYKAEIGSLPTNLTDLTGTADNTRGETKGPWLQSFPVNQLTGSDAVTNIDSAAGEAAANNDAEGWIYDTATGKVYGCAKAADDMLGY